MIDQAMAQRVPEIVEDFHTLFYNDFDRTWLKTEWLGVTVLKCPMDLFIYQELLFRTKPDLVIECGTAHGGSALYLATIMDLLDHGRVVTIDICGEDIFPNRPVHDRIEYLWGSSTDEITSARAIRAAGAGTVLVILDSAHGQAHVARELEMYAPLVTTGSYLIVEDTNVNGHPICPEHGPGPMEALEAFLPQHPEFEVDRSCEKFYLTFNPGGYLRRKP